ncbi:MAG TPA: FadR/GntR family transcriptional regulator [Anaeromyxobacteraceae bacterium]|nr:FadR/GntR family transcriptional regulator [Anaeromyxobacteraceae bacterium]
MDAEHLTFTAVRKKRLFEDLARQIQKLIVDGVLKPGDRLPPERQLAELFGVSRNSVRDAIRVLELTGMVIARQGEGNVVADVSTDTLVAPIAMLLLRKRTLVAELLDVRKMLEPALAARAAVHASTDQIARLESILQRQHDKAARGQPAVEEDSEFHYTIALAAKNSVVLKLLDVLMDLLRETRARSLQVDGRRERSLAGHRRVLEAIKRRDPAAAERAVRQHLEEIEAVVLKEL